MANATKDLKYPEAVGENGRDTILRVAANAVIWRGTFVAQLAATGGCVRGGTALSGPAIGVAAHGANNTGGAIGDKEITVADHRTFIFNNGLTTDAFSAASLIGAPAYILDDNTVADNDGSATLFLGGFFRGMEPDGRVRVYVDAVLNKMFVDLAA
jgi:hypothetical protein